MMVTLPFLSQPIDFNKSAVQILTVENPVVFRDLIVDFTGDDTDERIIFSENFTPFPFAKKALFIENPLFPETALKKLKTKTDKELEHMTSNQFCEDYFEVVKSLNSLGEKLRKSFDFDFNFNSSPTPGAIIKLLDFTPDEDSATSHPERFLQYLRLYRDYLGIKCVVTMHLYEYFTREELKALFFDLSAENYALLDIENTQAKRVYNEQLTILDKDLCEILDNNAFLF